MRQDGPLYPRQLASIVRVTGLIARASVVEPFMHLDAMDS
jgi:hypothetical protein